MVATWADFRRRLNFLFQPYYTNQSKDSLPGFEILTAAKKWPNTVSNGHFVTELADLGTKSWERSHMAYSDRFGLVVATTWLRETVAEFH